MQTLTFSKMSKAYGGVPALSDVTLRLRAGRVHALMGENGAGKSTLIKLIAGVVPADGLVVEKDGRTLPLANAQDAHDAGFRFIHQELNIVPQVSVAENILIGHDLPRRWGVAVDWPRVRAAAAEALAYLGADHIRVTALAGDLPAGDRMLVKIAAALVAARDEPAALYVLDEPTAALTGAESEMLFSVIERLRAEGAAILYVSHRMDEVLRISDEVTVLRDGRHVMTRDIDRTSKTEIIEAMTGRDVSDAYPPRRSDIGGRSIATLRGATTADLAGLDFDLREGEVLGVTGLAEAGQGRLLQMFMGLGRVRSGEARFDGAPLPRSPAEAWARGVAYIPRERRSEALCLDMPVRSNIVLSHLTAYGAIARTSRETRDARAFGDKVRLKSGGPEQPVRELSGGNQQKAVFARALLSDPKLLLLDEPTRGVDVGAKYDIYELVRDLSARGCAVILTSSDLDEILGMCDRVIVMRDGGQAGLLDRGTMTSADLLSHFYSDSQAG